MCGRFVAASDPDGLVRFFVIDDRKDDDLPPSYNVAPTDPVRAVVEHHGTRLLVTFRWGLVPSWAEDRRGAARMINARAETVADKPAYRVALARRRCLVPADGFYEWRRTPDGSRMPHFIHHGEGETLALAGLWEVWRDPAQPEAEPLRTCTIVTTAAHPSLASLHDRMPVALRGDRWDAWLDRDLRDPLAARALLQGHGLAGEELRFHEVSTAVNSVRNNGPDLVRRVPA